jgi:biopolymer transport protein ExbD
MNIRPRRREDEVDITLVAFIDVVLVIIMFLMLAGTFSQEGRVRIVLPSAKGTPPAEQRADPLVVGVSQSGSYSVNDQELINSSPETLRAALVKVAGQDRTARITLRADGRATHQSVVTAMDVLGRLGFAEINVATIRDEQAAGRP